MKRKLEEEIRNRILLLDGAMGTMIQSYNLTEEDFRGERFRSFSGQMKGNNDLLTLTRPDVITEIHRQYLEAGADLITTNTFNSQRISMAEYHCEDFIGELNRKAVSLARTLAEQYSTTDKPRYVIATIGPTAKSCSISPDVNDPAARSIGFDILCRAYEEQITFLLEAGPDAIMFETIFDTLNVKAGICAFNRACKSTGIEIPLMLSVTVNDRNGRMLCGQTLEAFVSSIAHAPLFSVGLNCSFGAKDMLPCLRILNDSVPYYISAHPNAGLPNTMGTYDQTPDMMYDEMEAFVHEGLVNIIGGCCGTTPEHIKALEPLTHIRNIHTPKVSTRTLALSGLERLELNRETRFINVGERCNVAGSKKFLRLIKEGEYTEALSIARKQVEDGAMLLDINMDGALLDAAHEMTHFLNLISSDPDICKVPLMIDSSDWHVIISGLKCVQGKCVVNSISLKEGEEFFLSRAREAHEMGAALVVMAFDEQGQAVSYERKIEVCSRAYRLLTEKAHIPPTDIIFDPNILIIATGMPEDDTNAIDFIRAAEWIRENLPGAHVSGGVSNLSFAFRGNNWLREAIHAVFLYHAQKAGMDFGIVNPSAKVTYEDIPKHILNIIEQAILNPSAEHRERLIALASELVEEKCCASERSSCSDTRCENTPVEERLAEALRCGQPDFLESDLKEALRKYPHAVQIIEGPLMNGMNRVGTLFGEGKMFLPQVIKTARTMKQAVELLLPHIQSEKTQVDSKGKILLATVKGDVHDIGKNIVGVVMGCSGYEICDLGVMVPPEVIVEKAKTWSADIIGLSGLITPSLEEMIRVVRMLDENGIRVPVMIGGATTSELHTALKIAPAYHGPIVWVKDASLNSGLAAKLLSKESHQQTIMELQKRQEELRKRYEDKKQNPLIGLDEARKRKLDLF